MDGPDGKIAHAELKIGDSVIMLSDEMPGSETRSPQSLGGTTSGVFLYVKDVDAVFHKATTARAFPERKRIIHGTPKSMEFTPPSDPSGSSAAYPASQPR